jgi:tetratricopeptide (TPR) repeat protein
MSKIVNFVKPNKNNVFLIFLILIIGIIGGVIFWQLQFQSIDDKEPVDKIKISDSAQVFLDNEDIQGALEVYDEAIKSTDDPKLKDHFLGNKIIVYYNSGDYVNAAKTVDLFINSEQVSTIEEYIARMYELEGDRDKAIFHYNRAIQYVDPESPVAKDYREFYQNKIILLEE